MPVHRASSPDRAIARLATRQHGVVTRTQLLEAGVSRHEIEHRVGSGQLHPVHRGVYRVGHQAPAPRAREMAAVLACGSGAAISHRSAARMWGLMWPDADDGIDITVPGRRAPRHPNIRAHRTTRLEPRDITAIERIPVTTAARTILDLAALLRPYLLDRIVAEAQVQQLVDPRALTAQIDRHPRRPGTRALRSLLDLDRGPAPTRSEAERRFLALVRKAELPAPLVNARIGRFEVDFHWRIERLVVEIDGYAYHSNRRAFERDRARDAALASAGYVVLRFTWRQLTRAPEIVIARVSAALAARLSATAGAASRTAGSVP